MKIRLSYWAGPMLIAAVLATASAIRAERNPPPPHLVMYKSAECECCLRWGSLLTEAGFTLEVRIADDLSAVFAEHGVAQELMSCHLVRVDGYAVVGHVPVADVQRLLRERPAIAGLSVPGMPASAPGMDQPGTAPTPYEVIGFDGHGATSVYARH